jgi:S1-C subfamily serine protease
VSVIDVVLLVAAVLFAVTGWRRGLLYGLLSLVGFLLGAAVGLWLAPKTVESWQDGWPKALAALSIVFIAAAIGQVVMGMAGRRMQGAVTWGPMLQLNSIGGAVLSVVTLMLVAWFLAGTYASGNSSSLARDVRQSQVLGAVDAVMPIDAYVITGQIESMFDSTGFPDVFAGLKPEPISPISAPDSAIARRPPVEHAAQQTVKVLGDAPSCDTSLEGSGFSFAPDRILTNAHVVAGTKHVDVETADGDKYNAEVVYFDPSVDLAVLKVPGLPVDPLQFSNDVQQGDSVAAIGYPENGGLDVEAARVRDELTASGNDIYNEKIVMREVLSLRADVRPGNSGGPLVLPNGEVVGVVFAASVDDDHTGYAMSSRQVADALDAGLSADHSVDTGDCT